MKRPRRLTTFARFAVAERIDQDSLDWWQAQCENRRDVELYDSMYDEALGPDRPGTHRWEPWMEYEDSREIEQLVTRLGAEQQAARNVAANSKPIKKRRVNGYRKLVAWADDNQLRHAIANAATWADVAASVHYSLGRIPELRKRADELGIETSHFKRLSQAARKPAEAVV
jgi:hypothetical protein